MKTDARGLVFGFKMLLIALENVRNNIFTQNY